MNIESLVIPDNSLNNLLIFYIIDCPKLTKLTIGNNCLARLDTLRICNLSKLTSFSIGDETFDDGSAKAYPVSSKEEACTRKLDSQFKNKSFTLQCMIFPRILYSITQVVDNSFRTLFMFLCAFSPVNKFVMVVEKRLDLPSLSVVFFGFRSFYSSRYLSLESLGVILHFIIDLPNLVMLEMEGDCFENGELHMDGYSA